MDTNLTKVEVCKAQEAELRIRSLGAQGYQLLHLAATQGAGFMGAINVVMVFGREKQTVIQNVYPAANLGSTTPPPLSEEVSQWAKDVRASRDKSADKSRRKRG